MARRDYRLADGTKVQGVTTIIGILNKPALVYWAYKRGKDGLDLYESRDKAADAGTLAHDMIQTYLHGGEPDTVVINASVTEDVKDQATTAFLNFLEWAQARKLKPVLIEEPLVSEEYRYGGTPDLIAQIDDGLLAVVDWKTSAGIYLEALIQVSAYRWLWEETHPDQPIKGGFHILRFDKDHGDWTHRYYEELDDAWEAFKYIRPLHNLLKPLEKRTK